MFPLVGVCINKQARAASKGTEEAATVADVSKEAAPAAMPAAPEATASPAKQQESNGHALPGHGGMQPKKGKKRKAGQGSQYEEQSEPLGTVEERSSAEQRKENGGSDGAKAPKWKKLATEVLQGRKDRKMKVAKLQAKVLSASGLGADALGDHSAAMLRRWAISKKFVVQDGCVSLA